MKYLLPLNDSRVTGQHRSVWIVTLHDTRNFSCTFFAKLILEFYTR